MRCTQAFGYEPYFRPPISNRLGKWPHQSRSLRFHQRLGNSIMSENENPESTSQVPAPAPSPPAGDPSEEAANWEPLQLDSPQTCKERLREMVELNTFLKGTL